MKIGLLVTEIDDREARKICLGAGKAAEDKDIKLILIPGGYIPGDRIDKDSQCSYQNNVLYDYAINCELDGVIVDIDRIASKSTILKKEAFLRRFGETPVFTFSEQEGCVTVGFEADDDESFIQLGYQAVSDVINYLKEGKTAPEESEIKISGYDKSYSFDLLVISDMTKRLFNVKQDHDKYLETLYETAIEHGIKNSAVFLYEKAIKNTVKYPWVFPEKMISEKTMIDGKILSPDDPGNICETRKLFSIFENSGVNTFILGDIYVNEYQLGIAFSEFFKDLFTEKFYEIAMSTITGIIRISGLQRQLERTTEELLEVQEELAKDDSVLDHIGDNDFLTGGLNRRGFFSKAYDLLKVNFAPGKYAIVAYIHMESLKRINSIFGHDEGDKAVKKVASILAEVFGDCVYGRIRGDEFAVITISDEEGLSETLRDEMSDQNNKLLAYSSRYINRLQYSICEFSYEDNLSLSDMLKETDENLQRLKRKD